MGQILGVQKLIDCQQALVANFGQQLQLFALADGIFMDGQQYFSLLCDLSVVFIVTHALHDNLFGPIWPVGKGHQEDKQGLIEMDGFV